MPKQLVQPQARDRVLGARLRAIRRARTTLNLEAAAEVLGWALATMSRLENGERHITAEDVAFVVTAYGLTAPERDTVIADAAGENRTAGWDPPLPGISPDHGTLASYLTGATALTDWATTVIPALLQTQDYALALLRTSGLDPDTAHDHWAARHTQQKILGTRDYTAYITETALRTPFGGPAAHRTQLHHLLNAHDRGIPVRVMRAYHPTGLVTHSWLHMTFPNTTPVVAITTPHGTAYLHHDQATPYTDAITTLNHIALTLRDSQSLLRQIHNQTCRTGT